MGKSFEGAPKFLLKYFDDFRSNPNSIAMFFAGGQDRAKGILSRWDLGSSYPDLTSPRSLGQRNYLHE
jgi:hypothetical protein